MTSSGGFDFLEELDKQPINPNIKTLDMHTYTHGPVWTVRVVIFYMTFLRLETLFSAIHYIVLHKIEK